MFPIELIIPLHTDVKSINVAQPWALILPKKPAGAELRKSDLDTPSFPAVVSTLPVLPSLPAYPACLPCPAFPGDLAAAN